MTSHRVAAAAALLLALSATPPLAHAATIQGIVEDSGRTWIKVDGVTYHVAPGGELETQGGERIDSREMPPGTRTFVDLDDRGRVVAVRPLILR